VWNKDILIKFWLLGKFSFYMNIMNIAHYKCKSRTGFWAGGGDTCLSIIPGIQEAETGGCLLSPAQAKLVWPYLKYEIKARAGM
jgi:hypothetical protein